MQQNHAKLGGERVVLTDLLEDALRLNACGLARNKVEVIRQYDAAPSQVLDKHKVLQILVNLLRNAEHACAISAKERREIVARVVANGETVRVVIADNGAGIPSENMTRIFQSGFTTKKDGHGF